MSALAGLSAAQCLVILLLICAVCYAWIVVRPQWIALLGLRLFEWGLDAKALLAAGVTAQQGLDVFTPMAADPLQRMHIYSSWWLGLGYLGLTVEDNTWFSAVIAGLFLIAMFSRLRPHDMREVLVFAAGACSPPIIFGLIRANNDLVIFPLLSCAIPCLGSGRVWVRFCAMLPLAIATGLKFYPILGGLILLGEPHPRVRIAQVAVGIIVLGLTFASVWPDFVIVSTNQPYVADSIPVGAYLLPRELGMGARPALLLFGLIIVILAVVATVARPFRSWSVPAGHETDYLWFILGATVLSGCFWAGISFGYRWIFALWLLPFLVRILWRSTYPALRPLLWTIFLTLWPLLYGDALFALASRGLRKLFDYSPPFTAFQFTLALQPFAWACFGALTLFVAQFAVSRIFVPPTRHE